MRVLAATIANAGVRASGVVREVVFAGAFGAGPEADALNAALRVPNLFRDVFAEGAFAHAFLPVFARSAAERGDAEGWRFLNAVLFWLTCGAGLVAATAILFPSAWVTVVASGFPREKAELAATLVQASTPFLVGLALASAIGASLTVKGRVVPAVAAPAMVNLTVLVACLLPGALWAALGTSPIVGVALATTLGGLGAVAAQVPALWGAGWRPALVLRHPDASALLTFVVPALAGVVAVQGSNLVDVQLAARLGDGAVSHITYALRVIQLPMHLFAGSVAAAALATAASAVAEGRVEDGRSSAIMSIGLVAFLVAPVSIALFFRADDAVGLLFQRGAFTPADTAAVGSIVAVYAVGGVAMALHRLLVPTLFAWGDARSPLAASLAVLVLRVPLSVFAAAPDRLGAHGIALAHTVGSILEVGLLFALLDRRAGGLLRPVVADVLRTAVASLAMAGVLGGAPGLPLLLAGPLAGLAFLGVAWLAGSPHVTALASRVARRLGRT